ncbi:MAG: fused MFS/spermidine synthase [Lachnospiraceae bacterium]|nr:fused MFS/spermidine synthase [Lachnospiraceae bacterium]
MKERKILKNRFYLYLTEFFAGMSVMAVELGASRLLAPYFSSSQIVWTIIIGTIMIAMALGNLYGGRSADKKPDPDILYGRILLAAVWIAAIPLLGKYLILAIAGVMIFTVNSNYLIVAAFAACMLVFVFPLFLLGTVTPSLVKYSVSSLEDSGSVVGRLNAFNTIGSIIGTFVPTFISIPAVGTAVSFLIFAGILLILAAVYFLSEKLFPLKLPISVSIFIICCIFGHDASFAFWQDDLSYEGESVYNYLQVYENDRQVVLSTNVLFGVQSVYRKEKELTGMYYDYAMAGAYMAGVKEKDSLDVLILGMGTGTFATQCERYFGNMKLTGVEIDAKITKLAREYFELPDSVPVIEYDGRAFLNADTKQYDLILVDAYQDITIPFSMSSQEFYRLVQAHLKPEGVMVMNMNMHSDIDDNITDWLADTVASVFPCVYTVDVRGSSNRELYAYMDTECMERFSSGIEKEESTDLAGMMRRVEEGLQPWSSGGRLLTDDRAPVELLGMRMIDSLIENEVGLYKDIYKEEGLQGLLDIL